MALKCSISLIRRLRQPRRLALALLLVTGGFKGCGDDGVTEDKDAVVRWWRYDGIRSSGVGEELLQPEGLQAGGEVNDSVDLGAVALHPRGKPDSATLEVFSSDTGLTYWVSSVAPSAAIRRDDVIGDAAHLEQIQIFRKDTDAASLKLVVNKVLLEAIDADAAKPTLEECPWQG